jgi:predicted GH43/DUF377 family glycosyl hydrolase
MDDWTGGVDFGPLDVLRVDIRIGYGGTWDNFVGYADDVEINDYLQTFDDVEPVWTKYSGNPVVTGSMAVDPCVIKDGSTYKMWYSHRDNSGVWSIYYADSSDGVTWSNKQQVLTVGGSGVWDAVRVNTPSVIKDGSTYKMWYTGRDASVPPKERIGYATSTDGTTWTRQGTALNPGAGSNPDALGCRDPVVITRNSNYELWYQGQGSAAPNYRVLRATSSDGLTWTKVGEVLLHPDDPLDGNERIHADSVIVQPDNSCKVFFGKESGTPRNYYIYTEVVNP